MKHVIVLFLLVFAAPELSAQSHVTNPYNPEANAGAQLDEAIERAAILGKHVLVVVGGNWCAWCRKLDKLFKQDTLVNAVLNADYILLHVNYSEENKNLSVMKRLGHPERFGFPVLVILDGSGHRIHTQDSALLESGSAHSAELVVRMLRMWGPVVMDPSMYR
jgi:thioredoxin-related protein